MALAKLCTYYVPSCTYLDKENVTDSDLNQSVHFTNNPVSISELILSKVNWKMTVSLHVLKICNKAKYKKKYASRINCIEENWRWYIWCRSRYHTGHPGEAMFNVQRSIVKLQLWVKVISTE